MSDRLDRAIEEFEDETSNLTLSERISGLRQALLWNAFKALKKIRKYGKKDPISEDEEYKQIQCMKYFKEIESMYNSEIKASKLAGKSSELVNAEFLKKIKEIKSSIGDIITTIPN